MNRKRWAEDPSRAGDPCLRHSVYGAHVCLSVGLPEEIAHIALGHSLEGQHIGLSTECYIVRHADHTWWHVAGALGLLEARHAGRCRHDDAAARHRGRASPPKSPDLAGMEAALDRLIAHSFTLARVSGWICGLLLTVSAFLIGLDIAAAPDHRRHASAAPTSSPATRSRSRAHGAARSRWCIACMCASTRSTRTCRRASARCSTWSGSRRSSTFSRS